LRRPSKPNEDARIDNPQQQIEAIFCGSVYPSKGTAEVADALKLFGRPVSMTQNYCATGTDAFRYGVFSIACGLYDTVMVVGFDKPKGPWRLRSQRRHHRCARPADDPGGVVFAVRGQIFLRPTVPVARTLPRSP